REIAAGYPAVNKESGFRGCKQLPRLRAGFFAVPVAIRINAARDARPALRASIVDQSLSVEDRGQILFDSVARGSLNYAANLAPAALDDHGGNVCDGQRLN